MLQFIKQYDYLICIIGSGVVVAAILIWDWFKHGGGDGYFLGHYNHDAKN